MNDTELEEFTDEDYIVADESNIDWAVL